MNLGISLKVAIAKSPMNNKMLAEMIPTSAQQVTNWIASGSINPKSLKRICELLDMKVSEFVALGGIKKPRLGDSGLISIDKVIIYEINI